jgi:peptide/nickel transport system permease protein
MTTTLDAPEAIAPVPPRRVSVRMRRFRQNRAAAVAGVIILILLVACVIGPFFAQDPTLVVVTDRFATPSAAHWLGTDDLGRDVLARILSGGRVAFLVAVLATAVAVIPACVLGIIAGYRGGLADDLFSRIFDVLLAIPSLLLGIIVVSALGPSLPSIIIAIGIADIPRYGRLFRALTLEAKEREYVASAVALGYSGLRISLRHILPNIYVPVMVIATSLMGRVALSEASLSFLGVGIQPPHASWGNMISEGQQFLQSSPILALAPGVALTILTLAFSFFGDGLRTAFDVREPGAR